MRVRIGQKFGTRKGLIKADLSTNVGRNPMNIHGGMTDYLRKIRSKICHAIGVSIIGVSIIGVPFCSLKGIGIKTMEV